MCIEKFLCSLPSPTNELSNSINLPLSELQEALSGGKPLTIQVIIDFLDSSPELSINWLINGFATMELDSDNTEDERVQELKYTIQIKLLKEFELKVSKREIKALCEQPPSILNLRIFY